MTAINTVVRADRAYLITDGAGYDSNGRLIGSYDKVVTMPNLSVALAVRGSALVLAFVRAMLADVASSFDDLIEKGPERLRQISADLAGPLAKMGGQSDFELYAVGYSDEEQRFRSFALSSAGSDLATPFEFVSIDGDGGLSFSPVFSDINAMVAAHVLLKADNLLNFTAETFDPDKHARGVMEMQRHQKIVPNGLSTKPIHIVGRHILLTEIDRSGIRQRILHRWQEDEIGKFIVPDGPKLPNFNSQFLAA